jgi:hypothetical protein
MDAPLPPIPDARRLAREITLVGRRVMDDSVQEAWVAYLEGRDPVRAVKAFAQRERRHRRRNVTGIETDG